MNEMQNGISKYAVGTIWWLFIDDEENTKRALTFRMTKTRPYIIISHTNSAIEIAPITSSSNKNDFAIIKIPRVEGNDAPWSYIVLPSKERISYDEFKARDPKYIATVSRNLLMRIISTNIVFETLCFSISELSEISDNVLEIRNKISSINYYNSPWFRHLENDVNEISDIEEEEDGIAEDEIKEGEINFVPVINDQIKALADKLKENKIPKSAKNIYPHEEVINDIICKDPNSNICISDFSEIYKHITGANMDIDNLKSTISTLGYAVTGDIIIGSNMCRFNDIFNTMEYRTKIIEKYPYKSAAIITGLAYTTVIKYAANGDKTKVRFSKENIRKSLCSMCTLNYDVGTSRTLTDELAKMVTKTEGYASTSKELYQKFKDHGINYSQSDIEQSLNMLGYKSQYINHERRFNYRILPEFTYNLKNISMLIPTSMASNIVKLLKEKKTDANILKEFEGDNKRIVNAYLGWYKENGFQPYSEGEMKSIVEEMGLTYASLYYGLNYYTVAKRYTKIKRNS